MNLLSESITMSADEAAERIGISRIELDYLASERLLHPISERFARNDVERYRMESIRQQQALHELYRTGEFLRLDD